MPRPRLPETPQRQSPRGPPSLRTSSSDSDHQHPRPRNPKPSEGRSVRSTQSDPSNPKKLGTRIANLESQLGLAQEELRSLKDQLVSVPNDQPGKKPKNHTEEKQCSVPNDPKSSVIVTYETSDDDHHSTLRETDVFEVPVIEQESALLDDLASRNDEINSLRAELVEKDKEAEVFRRENERLKSQLDDMALKASSAEARVEELTLRLEKSKADLLEKDEKFESSEKAKVELEKEMHRLRVQSEQWRKAADAAASVLAGGMETNGQRLSERCGSMDKVYTNSFEGVGRYVGSPGLGGDGYDVFGGDKRKTSAGIKMLGELWKKKGHK